MKAWEYDYKVFAEAVPKIIENAEDNWAAKADDDNAYRLIRKQWYSEVPGSGAPEVFLISATASMEQMGYDVSEAEVIIPLALDALSREDRPELTALTSRMFAALNRAPKVEDHPYWSYGFYESFDDIKAEVEFEKYDYTPSREELVRKTHGGWVAQIAGAALGTAIEGYTTEALTKKFGVIDGYVRKPDTYNDDVNFEIAFLEAFKNKGYDITSTDIAEQWAARVTFGVSAEGVALRNIGLGIMPPESGIRSNPWRDWIGAQMRGAICGMVAPGNPEKAAELAFTDARVSHWNNGILGEVFNALLVSLSYVESDIRAIVEKAVSMIPAKSEYYSVVKFALDACRESDNWQEAWGKCFDKYKYYNWIHAYPNAAAEVVALWFGTDFDTCMTIISMEGEDVDCNAAQIATLYGVIFGREAVGSKWDMPTGDEFLSFVRGYEKTTVTALAELTVDSYLKAVGK